MAFDSRAKGRVWAFQRQRVTRDMLTARAANSGRKVCGILPTGWAATGAKDRRGHANGMGILVCIMSEFIADAALLVWYPPLFRQVTVTFCHFVGIKYRNFSSLGESLYSHHRYIHP